MADRPVKRELHRSVSISAAESMMASMAGTEDKTKPKGNLRKSASSMNFEEIRRANSLKHSPTRRLSSIRTKPRFGYDTDAYERIGERLLKERAVVNAKEALQDRWQMIMFMYEDCMAAIDAHVQNKQRKISIKRQSELIIVLVIFVLVCLPLAMICVVLCKWLEYK